MGKFVDPTRPSSGIFEFVKEKAGLTVILNGLFNVLYCIMLENMGYVPFMEMTRSRVSSYKNQD